MYVKLNNVRLPRKVIWGHQWRDHVDELNSQLRLSWKSTADCLTREKVLIHAWFWNMQSLHSHMQCVCFVTCKLGMPHYCTAQNANWYNKFAFPNYSTRPHNVTGLLFVIPIRVTYSTSKCFHTFPWLCNIMAPQIKWLTCRRRYSQMLFLERKYFFSQFNCHCSCVFLGVQSTVC